MKVRAILFQLFLFVGFIVSCNSQSLTNSSETSPPLEEEIKPTPKVTLTSLPRKQTLVAVNIPSPSLTQDSMLVIQPTSTKEVEINHMQMECVYEVNYAPESLGLNGMLAIQSTEGSFLLDLRTGEIIQLIDGLMSKAVSPNGYLVAVEVLSSPNTDIFDSSGNLITSLNLPQDYHYIAWIDNENVLLLAEPIDGGIYPYWTSVVYNVFTGKQILFFPDYPGITTKVTSVGQFWGGPRLVLDPTLSYLVYPTSNYDVTDLGDYVLWDIEAGQEIARLYMFLRDARAPVWSPSGDRFVVEARLNLIDYEVGSEMNKPLNANDVPTEYGGYELFTMDLTGETHRLTYVNPTRWGDFADYVWSPDGSKIATWITLLGGGFLEGDELAILDVETGELINYCIKGHGPIYWSQDGDYLAIGSVPPKDENSDPYYYTNNVAVINWKEGWFVELYENAEPAGWMKSP